MDHLDLLVHLVVHQEFLVLLDQLVLLDLLVHLVLQDPKEYKVRLDQVEELLVEELLVEELLVEELLVVEVHHLDLYLVFLLDPQELPFQVDLLAQLVLLGQKETQVIVDLKVQREIWDYQD